ncbi:PREDICTED: uncharacterized protein LOC106787889 [Polistes canadensis]|uniref:uncharacterized protein LOC106787889 n=1 Tax=Polistes canadensis TaxID=91411 RepID=UPI0007190171|nr:PREDICTED: uncharacterized protein LOC106787889 [Polistes canadensis]XP_014606112.1 PREDICTED: uncharacterized protein LOC106787889 [Polistes canadensis]XP_014606113.1 PREDICTED: uncharacterized protein LOC106787889 [Polistes canadensis]XP_014606114.1 PREDICTED: uncharacterized protein LOC106787889 [Polistes canadensis]
MAEETPPWLNPEFVENILRKARNDDSIRVIDICSKPATAKGDNYTSDMYRISAEISCKQAGEREVTEKTSLIVKVAPTGDTLKSDLIEKSKIFDTEISMMMNLLKKMNDLVGPGHTLGARIYYVQKEYPVFLVIEDLAPLGFRMADRQAGLDLTHSLMAMRGLARFHASSLAICEKEPNNKTIYTRGIYFNGHPPELTSFFSLGTKCLAAQVKQWPNFEKYAEKIDKISDKIYSETCKVLKQQDDEFNVINHGDFWVNNMMFRYNDEGKPIDHIFVDFQMCVYGSPALDLQYFLSTSPNNDVYENKKETLINEYYSTLCKTMKQLDCKTPPPSMEKLQKSIDDYEMVAMISSFAILPLVLVDRKEAKDINEIMGTDGGYDDSAYKTDIYREVISKRIPYYDQLGLMDF